MEKGEFLDEIFDLRAIFPEIFSNGRSTKPQISDNINRLNNNSSSSNCTAAVPKIISFESSNSPEMGQNSINPDNNDYSLTSEIINFSFSVKDDSSSNDEYCPHSSREMNLKRTNSAATRTPSQAMDHVVAERKRRENLSQLFISLSKVVPGLKKVEFCRRLKSFRSSPLHGSCLFRDPHDFFIYFLGEKLDKASLLDDGINYVKAMQERVRILEEEEERRGSIDAAAVKADSSSSHSPEIQARISEKHVLIKIFCKNKMGLMSRIPCEMVEMHLNVLDMRIMPFGGTSLDITILAEMQGEFEGTATGIVEHLHALYLK